MIKCMKESGINVRDGDSGSKNGVMVPFILVSGREIRLMGKEE